MKNKGLYLISTIGSFILTFIIALATGAVIPTVIAFIPSSLFLARLLPAYGQLIEDSIFQVHKTMKGEYKICQNSLANPEKIMDFYKIKDTRGKISKIEDEAITTFSNLKEKDSKGIKITYITSSQGLTKYMLTKAEKYGYIENLVIKKRKKESRLRTEKMLIGNSANKKKNKVYDFSFQLTDKPRDIKELKKMIKR